MHRSGQLEIPTGTLTPIGTDLGDGRALARRHDLQALKAAVERICKKALAQLDDGRLVDEPPLGELWQQQMLVHEQ